MEKSAYLHAPASLPPRERSPVPIQYEARWAPELVWTLEPRTVK